MNQKTLLIIRLVVGVVFILSAVSKLKSLGIFEIILIDQGLTADRTAAAYFARALISLELFMGVAFFQPFLLKRLVAPLTFISLTAFSIYLVYLMIFAGNTENCGCFGDVIEMSPLESLLKNLVLMGLAAFLFLRLDSEKNRWAIPTGLFIGCFVFIFAAFPIRSADDNAFIKYTHFEPIGRVDLTSGEHLVAVLDLDCPHCREMAEELGALDRNTNSLPRIYFLFYGDDDGSNSVQYFFYLTSTEYPYHIISEDEFFDLIGSAPPRLYYLHDGKIKATWDEDIVANMARAFGINSREKGIADEY